MIKRSKGYKTKTIFHQTIEKPIVNPPAIKEKSPQGHEDEKIEKQREKVLKLIQEKLSSSRKSR